MISRTSVNRDITEAAEGSAIGDGDAALESSTSVPAVVFHPSALVAYVNQPKALVLI